MNEEKLPPEFCDRENCWERPTKQLDRQNGEIDGYYCDEHAQSRKRFSHERLKVVATFDEEKAA